MTSRYWQHQTPLRCPKHKREDMGWLGAGYWLCRKCKAVYVQVKDGHGQWEVDDPRGGINERTVESSEAQT